jgi:predicted DCC family thiol-disulfide oxidoreductase YuxK
MSNPTTETPATPGVTVYYDGSCPLCSSEIALYRRCRGADAVTFADVSAATGDVQPGLSREAAMRRFHVRDAEGRLLSGGAAFAALWAALPGLSLWGRLFQRQPLAFVLEGAYRLFLPLRPWLQRLARKAG